MNYRINAGYVITDSVHVGNKEFVLGVHNTAPSQFVTWQCTNGKEYDWGHYYNDMLSATKDLLHRAYQELEYCMDHENQSRTQQDTVSKEQEDFSL